MRKKLLDLIKNPKSKNIAINTFGNYLNIFFIAILQPILFRILSPEEYAVFGVLTTISYLLTNILDFGTPAVIYSYLPPLLVPEMRKQLYTFIKSTLTYQTLFAGIVVCVLFISFDFLDSIFFKTEANSMEFFLSSVTVLCLVWQNFLINIFFASKQYLKANVALNISNVIRTIGIFALVVFDMISISSLLFMIGIVGPVFFYLILLRDKQVHISELLKSPVDRSEFRFKYTMTYFVGTQFLNVGMRMDLFLLSFFRTIISKPEVGYFAAAQKIPLTIMTTVVSVTQVLSPLFSEIKTQRDARKEFKHAFVYMLIPASLFGAVFFTPTFLFELFFGADFIPSIQIARYLSLPFMIYALGSIPMLFLLYTVKKSPVIMISYLLFFIAMTAGCYLLIPVYGLMAPPLVLGASFLLSTTLLSYFAFQEYQKLPA